jgi:hypothetical protein
MATLYFLECHSPEKHRIGIPAPTLAGSTPNPLKSTTDEKHAIFVCNRCGLVSSYSNKEIRSEESHTPDPFQSRAYTLQRIETKCDDHNCVAPKRIHEVFHVAGTPYPRSSDKWRNDGTAKCEAGHLLRWNVQEGHRYLSCSSPF